MERLNDCFAAGDRLLTVGEAAERLSTRLGPAVGRERVPLAEARGRILAEPLVSGLDVPGYDNAAVDGYAFAHGRAHYRIAGRAAAGRPFPHPLGPGEAVRILTGAPVPEGADTVAMQEDCELDGENRGGAGGPQGGRQLPHGRREHPPGRGGLRGRPAPRAAATGRRRLSGRDRARGLPAASRRAVLHRGRTCAPRRTAGAGAALRLQPDDAARLP